MTFSFLSWFYEKENMIVVRIYARASCFSPDFPASEPGARLP